MKIEKETEMKFTKISRELISSLTFREFSTTDYYGFAGVSSPIPLIAENDDEGILMIIDGGFAELYAYDGCANFDLIDSVDNINELPFKTEKQKKIENEILKMKEAIRELEKELV